MKVLEVRSSDISILEVLNENDGLTAKEIHTRLSEKGIDIPLRTLRYRLSKLVEQGILEEKLEKRNGRSMLVYYIKNKELVRFLLKYFKELLK